MAPLTWRNVAAPDFSGVADLMRTSGTAFDKGFTRISDALDQARQTQIRNRSAAVLPELAKVASEQDVDPLLDRLPGMINAKDMSPALQQALLGLRQSGMQFDTTRLAQEQKRASIAATKAASARASAAASRKAQRQAALAQAAPELLERFSRIASNPDDLALPAEEPEYSGLDLGTPADQAPALSFGTLDTGTPVPQPGNLLDLSDLAEIPGMDPGFLLDAAESLTRLRNDTRRSNDDNAARDLAHQINLDKYGQEQKSRETRDLARDVAYDLFNTHGTRTNAALLKIAGSDTFTAREKDAIREEYLKRQEDFGGALVPDSGTPLSDTTRGYLQQLEVGRSHAEATDGPGRILDMEARFRQNLAEGKEQESVQDIVSRMADSKNLDADPAHMNRLIQEVSAETGLHPGIVARGAEDSLKAAYWGLTGDLATDRTRLREHLSVLSNPARRHEAEQSRYVRREFSQRVAAARQLAENAQRELDVLKTQEQANPERFRNDPLVQNTKAALQAQLEQAEAGLKALFDQSRSSGIYSYPEPERKQAKPPPKQAALPQSDVQAAVAALRRSLQQTPAPEVKPDLQQTGYAQLKTDIGAERALQRLLSEAQVNLGLEASPAARLASSVKNFFTKSQDAAEAAKQDLRLKADALEFIQSPEAEKYLRQHPEDRSLLQQDPVAFYLRMLEKTKR